MRLPFAIWQPVPNVGGAVTRPARGLVLHVAVAPSASSVHATFSNPASQASSHFCVDVDGTIYQYVDTAEKAWAEAGGNSAWYSVETVGYPEAPLTAAQLTGVARILDALGHADGFPSAVTDDVNGSGLIDHGDGGSGWGGHTGCPGPIRSAQRAQICAIAQAMRGNPTAPTGDTHLTKPVVALLRTVTGAGYWEVAADGGVFSFGDAVFHGSLGNVTLAKPVVAAAVTPSGLGYWLVAADGGVFTFGDAGFHGGLSATALAAPVTSIIPSVTGNGYTLAAADGGTFTFGDAQYYGSAA